MASLLQKLLSKQSAKNIITTFNKPQPSNLVQPLLTRLHHEPHLSDDKFNLIPFLVPPKTGDSSPSLSPPIFPSFPFGFSLNPTPSTGFVPSDADVVSDDSHTIWADSVKKKRKKKMNKHKYKKLRKSLRRRT